MQKVIALRFHSSWCKNVMLHEVLCPDLKVRRCRASHGIASRDFVCHRSPNRSRSLWGRSPQSPERRDVYGERCSYRRPCDGNGEGKIQAKARRCGLSVTEYVKQRALGYEPRAVSPDARFACLERLSELADKAGSPELDKEISAVLKQITAEFLLPGKG